MFSSRLKSAISDIPTADKTIKTETPDETPTSSIALNGSASNTPKIGSFISSTLRTIVKEEPQEPCSSTSPLDMTLQKKINELTGIYMTNLFNKDSSPACTKIAQNGSKSKLLPEPEVDPNVAKPWAKYASRRMKGPLPLDPQFLQVYGIEASDKDGVIARCSLCNKDLTNNGYVRIHISSKKHKEAERYYKTHHLGAPTRANVMRPYVKMEQPDEYGDVLLTQESSELQVKEEPQEYEEESQEPMEEELMEPNDDPRTKYSRLETMQKRSWAYEAFDIENDKFKCKYCTKAIHRIHVNGWGHVNWGTSDLWNHLRRKHKEVFLDLKERPKESRPIFDYTQVLLGLPKEMLERILNEDNVIGGEENFLEPDQLQEREAENSDMPTISNSEANTAPLKEVKQEPSEMSEMTELVSIETASKIEETLNILEPSHKGDHYFYCKVCKRHIAKMRDNPKQRHLNSVAHKKNLQVIAKIVARPTAKPTCNSKPFLAEMCGQFEGIQPSSRGAEYYFCTYCKRDIVFTEISGIEKHCKTLVHIVNMTKADVSNSIDTDMADPFMRPAPRKHIEKPEAEKRPKTAFIFFLMEVRPKIVAENPGIHQMEVFKMIGQMWKDMPQAKKLKYYREEKRQRRLKNADNRIYRRNRAKTCAFKMANIPRSLRAKFPSIYPQKASKRWAKLKEQALKNVPTTLPNGQRVLPSGEIISDEVEKREIESRMSENSPSKNAIVKLEPEEVVEESQPKCFSCLDVTGSATPSPSKSIVKEEPSEVQEMPESPSKYHPIEGLKSRTGSTSSSPLSFKDILHNRKPNDPITEMLIEKVKSDPPHQPKVYVRKGYLGREPKTLHTIDSRPVKRHLMKKIVPPMIKRIDGKSSHPRTSISSDEEYEFKEDELDEDDDEEYIPEKKTRTSRSKK